MIRLWRLFAVVTLMSPLLADLASTQLLASELSESSLVGDYVCVVDAGTALVYGHDEQYHAGVRALPENEKTFFINIGRSSSLDPAGCAANEPDVAFLCYAQFKMKVKSSHSHYLFWSRDGYQFYDNAGGVINMVSNAEFTWAETIVPGFLGMGSWLREGRCNRVTR